MRTLYPPTLRVKSRLSDLVTGICISAINRTIPNTMEKSPAITPSKADISRSACFTAANAPGGWKSAI